MNNFPIRIAGGPGRISNLGGKKYIMNLRGSFYPVELVKRRLHLFKEAIVRDAHPTGYNAPQDIGRMKYAFWNAASQSVLGMFEATDHHWRDELTGLYVREAIDDIGVSAIWKIRVDALKSDDEEIWMVTEIDGIEAVDLMLPQNKQVAQAGGELLSFDEFIRLIEADQKANRIARPSLKVAERSRDNFFGSITPNGRRRI